MDASNQADTLKCHSPLTTQCPGPLVLNEFNACLKCGYKSAPKQTKQAMQTALRSGDKFLQTINKLHKEGPSLMASLLGFFVQRYKAKKLNLTEINQDNTGTVASLATITRARITKKRVAHLEKHLALYASVIYGSSYHLFEKCTLLLKVRAIGHKSPTQLTILHSPRLRSTTRLAWQNLVCVSLTILAALSSTFIPQ